MSATGAIDAYLHGLSRRLWIRHPLHRRAILRESEDHLRETAVALVASGMDAGEAEAAAVERFGAYPVRGLSPARGAAAVAIGVLALGCLIAVTRTTHLGEVRSAVRPGAADVPTIGVQPASEYPIPAKLPVDGYVLVGGGRTFAFADFRSRGSTCEVDYLANGSPYSRAAVPGAGMDCLPKGMRLPPVDLHVEGGSSMPGAFMLLGSVPADTSAIVVTDRRGRQHRFAPSSVHLRSDPGHVLVLVDLSRSGIAGVHAVRVFSGSTLVGAMHMGSA